MLENFQDVKEGDVLEAYETRQVERELELGAARRSGRCRSSSLLEDPPAPAGQRQPEGQAQGAAVGRARRSRGASARASRRSTTRISGSARRSPPAWLRARRRSSSAPRTESSAICSARFPEGVRVERRLVSFDGHRRLMPEPWVAVLPPSGIGPPRANERGPQTFGCIVETVRPRRSPISANAQGTGCVESTKPCVRS